MNRQGKGAHRPGSSHCIATLLITGATTLTGDIGVTNYKNMMEIIGDCDDVEYGSLTTQERDETRVNN